MTNLSTDAGLAALTFLWAQPDRLVCVEVAALAGPTALAFRRQDPPQADLEDTDLLFVDMLHDGDQLRAEVRRHAGKVRKYLVLHGTTAFAEEGETPGQAGIRRVREEFLAEGTFTLKQRQENNHGLTVLKRQGHQNES